MALLLMLPLSGSDRVATDRPSNRGLDGRQLHPTPASSIVHHRDRSRPSCQSNPCLVGRHDRHLVGVVVVRVRRRLEVRQVLEPELDRRPRIECERTSVVAAQGQRSPGSAFVQSYRRHRRHPRSAAFGRCRARWIRRIVLRCRYRQSLRDSPVRTVISVSHQSVSKVTVGASFTSVAVIVHCPVGGSHVPTGRSCRHGDRVHSIIEPAPPAS